MTDRPDPPSDAALYQAMWDLAYFGGYEIRLFTSGGHETLQHVRAILPGWHTRDFLLPGEAVALVTFAQEVRNVRSSTD